MGITVIYKGLKDQPVLVAGPGRHPPVERPPASRPPATPAAQAQAFLQSGGGGLLPQDLRRAEQDRVLAQALARVDRLAQAIDGLVEPAGNLPQLAKSALSPLPRALAAQADEQATAPALHTLEVQRTAQPGQILSPPQNPVALVDLSDGQHTFTLTIDGDEFEIAVEVFNRQGRVDTQEELLGRLARAIGGQDPRVQAEVVLDQQDAHDPTPGHRLLKRTARLLVRGVGPGQGASFSLADAQGELAGAYGLTSQAPPQAAWLRLGGALTSQASNGISLDNGHVAAQALDSTNGPLELAVESGAGTLTGQLQSVISQYNRLLEFLDLHADLVRPSLKDRIVRPLEDRAALMTGLGLKATAQGRLLEGPDFAGRVTGDFASLRQALLGPQGWTTALRAKMGQVRDLGPEAFGAGLDSSSLAQQRRRAWQALEQTRLGIIDSFF